MTDGYDGNGNRSGKGVTGESRGEKPNETEIKVSKIDKGNKL